MVLREKRLARKPRKLSLTQLMDPERSRVRGPRPPRKLQLPPRVINATDCFPPGGLFSTGHIGDERTPWSGQAAETHTASGGPRLGVFSVRALEPEAAGTFPPRGVMSTFVEKCSTWNVGDG
jgi:hypothetical protein